MHGNQLWKRTSVSEPGSELPIRLMARLVGLQSNNTHDQLTDKSVCQSIDL